MPNRAHTVLTQLISIKRIKNFTNVNTLCSFKPRQKAPVDT